jgi:hypothetical protein
MFLVENDSDYRTLGRFLPFNALAPVERSHRRRLPCVLLQGLSSGSFKGLQGYQYYYTSNATMLLANFAVADTTPPARHRT